VEQYRRDVDGLRAVAVIAVVLYHAGVTSMGGGYVGVDVFFVISGYLITKYVDQRIQDGRFRIVEFYERRVRRIMPALFFLLIVASVLGYFALFPSAFYDLAKSQIATTIFSPNLLSVSGCRLLRWNRKVKATFAHVVSGRGRAVLHLSAADHDARGSRRQARDPRHSICRIGGIAGS
jgi:hypothetical protein